MPTCHSWKTGLEFWKWRPYKVRSIVSNSIYAKKDRNGPPSANQVTSKDEPRCDHAVCTLRAHPPTSTCCTLSAHTEPKSQGHHWKWHHEAESVMTDIFAIGPKELIKAMNINFVPSRRHIQPLTTSTIQQRCMYGTPQIKWCRHSECFSEMRLQHSSCRKSEGFFRESKVFSEEAEGFFRRLLGSYTHRFLKHGAASLTDLPGLHSCLPEVRLCLKRCVCTGKAEQQQKGFRKHVSF